MKIGAFPPEAPFLAALARLWLAGDSAPSEGLLILPSRRSAQALAGAFLEANQGRALLLPRIIATGAVDEAGLTMAGALDLAPAVAPAQRQAILAKFILAMHGRNGAPVKLHAAWALAADLAALLDEADAAEIDLAEALPNLVAGELASHWQTTLEFLKIITAAWPAVLAERGWMNPGARQAALLDAQAQAWRDRPPAHRVWMVSAGGPPATRRLARTVAGLTQGLLLLPGYDFNLSPEAWEAVEDGHAMSGIAALLGAVGARTAEVECLHAPHGLRSATISRALLPAACLTEWQGPAPLDIAGLARLETPDEAQNATAIAMILRDALETPGRTAALVTPDRGLATRVAAALKRFGITADDSAGEPLEQSPPAVVLRLLARAAAAQYAPLPLLALLKHPLTAAGLPVERCREHARALELQALRGPRPAPGFDGIEFRLKDHGQEPERVFLARLEQMLRPLNFPEAVNPADALRALLTAGEALAATESESGAARLWAGEAGIALSEVLLETLAALEDLPDIALPDLPDVLDALLAGAVFRKPRTKDGHPRIAIWGLREAALQSVDVLVLGGLAEGVWPAAAEPGPWLSRSMRRAAGLPAPEEKISAAAHDFFALSCASPEVTFAAPRRRERAPAVPARWLTRLDAMLAGAGLVLPAHPAAGWAALLDQPLARERREKPYPRPEAAFRPATLSISEVATLLADPYAIYARKVLKIRELNRLDEESDPSIFGDIVHAGLAEFFRDAWIEAPDAVARLSVCLERAMRRLRPRAALEHWWAARLTRIAAWIIEAERLRRMERGNPAALDLEASAELAVAGGFVLKGRADRIETGVSGGVSILDYKTGTIPADADVKDGSAPQLPLEAVMAEAGAFAADFAGTVTELAYVKLSGRSEAGDVRTLFGKKPEALRAVIDSAAAALPELFAKFARAETPYLASPHPGRANRYDVYGGISRRAEWAGEEE